MKALNIESGGEIYIGVTTGQLPQYITGVVGFRTEYKLNNICWDNDMIDAIIKRAKTDEAWYAGSSTQGGWFAVITDDEEAKLIVADKSKKKEKEAEEIAYLQKKTAGVNPENQKRGNEDNIYRAVLKLHSEYGKYIEEEVKNHSEVKKLKEFLKDRFGYLQTIFLDDFSPTLDPENIIKKSGLAIVRERDLSDVGSWAGVVHEYETKRENGDIRYIYNLPMRGDIDTFANEMTITNKPLNTDEYISLRGRLEGKTTLNGPDVENNLRDTEKKAREEIEGTNHSAPYSDGTRSVLWLFAGNLTTDKISEAFLSADKDNINEVKNVLIAEQYKEIARAIPDASQEKMEGWIKKWSDWFDKNQNTIISVAKRIKEIIPSFAPSPREQKSMKAPSMLDKLRIPECEEDQGIKI